jgi:hypothetical protein
MANIIDYLAWRGDLGFDKAPFNTVDNIVLTHLSYLPFDGIVPGPKNKKSISLAEAAKKLTLLVKKDPDYLKNSLTPKDDILFIEALGVSGRFPGLELTAYVNRIDLSQEKQFSALTITFPKKSPKKSAGDFQAFIAYRGTDASLVGWKEDFNMSFNAEVPAQREAVQYLEIMAKNIKGPLRIGGHSKGGNLAVYASTFCAKKIQNRITAIYTNDAPGFNKALIESDAYKRIQEKIRSFVPQSSVVGMLFEHGVPYTVVKSTQTGLLQHDVFSWEITYNDVVRLNTVTQGSKFVNKTLNEWIQNLSPDQRQKFTDTLYDILISSEIKSLNDLSSGRLKKSKAILQSITSIDEPTRNSLAEILGDLLKAAKNNIHIVSFREQGLKAAVKRSKSKAASESRRSGS